MSLVWLMYYGDVGIALWEWLLSIMYLIVIYMYFGRLKNMRQKRQPEYRHFIRGLFAKMIGGAAFALIYFYYFQGGDTLMYFYSAVSMTKLATADPASFMQVLFGANDDAHLAMFAALDARPYGYMYFDPRSFMVIRLITPLVFLSFRSYLVTTLLFSSICYIGIWRCYQTFVGYFPSLTNKFAIAFLYIPSVIFWGSGIMKDTLTISAACWWVHCFDKVFFKKDELLYNIAGLVLAGVMLILLKPYIFMALMPVTFLWLLYYKVVKLRNVLLRLIVLPLFMVISVVASVATLRSLGDSLGKFSLDEALITTKVLQEDMKRSEQYGDNYFDIGTIDGTMAGTLSKFPVAVNAALFRPYVWESHNLVVLVSALENAFLLGLSLLVLWQTRIWFFIRCIRRNPMVMMCIVFSLAFAFMIGLTTPNFGALVRFKIPLVPFFVSALFIIAYLNKMRIHAKLSHKRFDLVAYIKGEPIPAPVRRVPIVVQDQ
ncbi:MAG: hypothetical protein KBF80_07635 [Flavobacteriales bacterium]|nr:hypothetical protein [Flavobacteriales bacterium]